jgi:hypothetical protein
LPLAPHDNALPRWQARAALSNSCAKALVSHCLAKNVPVRSRHGPQIPPHKVQMSSACGTRKRSRARRAAPVLAVPQPGWMKPQRFGQGALNRSAILGVSSRRHIPRAMAQERLRFLDVMSVIIDRRRTVRNAVGNNFHMKKVRLPAYRSAPKTQATTQQLTS